MTRKIINLPGGNLGDSTHVGTDDWDKINLYFTGQDQSATDPVTIATSTTFNKPINIFNTSAGAAGMEFGSNNATGGSAFMDWHVSSTDGDYSTRVIRESGVNGRYMFIQTGLGGFVFQTPNYDANTGPGPAIGIGFNQTATNAAPQQFDEILISTNYTATQSTSGFSLANAGLFVGFNYGSSTVNAMGTVQPRSTYVHVMGSASTNNEITTDFAVIQCDVAGTTSNWFTDYALLGPIGAQPGLLNGITMLVNEYYNGSPVRGPSGNWFITKPGAGGFADAAHGSATLYPVDVGLGIVGYAGTNAAHTLGFTTGLQIGGFGSGWMGSSQSSIIGTGINITDVTVAGLAIGEPSTTGTTATAISIVNSTTTYASGIDLSGGKFTNNVGITTGTTNLIKIGVNSTGANTPSFSANGPYVSGVNTPYTWLKFISNDGSLVWVPCWK